MGGAVVRELDAATCSINVPRKSGFKRQARLSTAQSVFRTRRSGSHRLCRGYFKTGAECPLKSEVAAAEGGIPNGRESGSDRAKHALASIGELMTWSDGRGMPHDHGHLAELDVEDRVDAGEQAVSREKVALELAKSKLDLLEKYTRDQTIKMLKLQVEEKRPEEQAKSDRWQHEQYKAKNLERQIAACTIRAPVDGTVVYANPPRQLARGPAFGQIEEGATVRERQKILSILDLNGKTLVATQHESATREHQVRDEGQDPRIDALPGQSLDGTVIEGVCFASTFELERR